MLVRELAQSYAARGVNLVRLAGGWTFRTAPDLGPELRSERVVAAEVQQAIRQSGALSVAEVHAVILETDGSFSVIHDPPVGDPSALGGMQPPDRDEPLRR